MASTGYDFAKAYADWVSCNQFRVAKMRLGTTLEDLCARKFCISRDALSKWATLSAPMLCDLLDAEESSEDLFDPMLPMHKKNVLIKYLGPAAADKYEDYFSLHHDAYQMIQRLETFLSMQITHL